jgi:carbonic anhydrase/acetyltransferase-like protein (isoleucine patch superfamily)
VNDIHIGENTNIQDHSILHVTEKDDLVIGKNTSVGHGVTLHGCTVEQGCLIGMGAIILDGAIIGDGSIVAAGSIVPPGKSYPSGSMIMGSPAKVVRELNDIEKNFIANHYKSYLSYANDFRNGDVARID